MMYRVSHPSKTLKGTVTLSASKSESNRILIIQALCRERFEIKNIATAEDTVTRSKIAKSDGGLKLHSMLAEQEQQCDF